MPTEAKTDIKTSEVVTQTDLYDKSSEMTTVFPTDIKTSEMPSTGRLLLSLEINMLLLKPRTDGQIFLDKFSLSNFICSCVREKIDKFSLIKGPCLKVSHASISTRKNTRVCGRERKLDKEF